MKENLKIIIILLLKILHDELGSISTRTVL